MKKRWF